MKSIELNARALSICMAALAVVSTAEALANGENVYLQCPCVLTGDGTNLTLTAGLRSFRDTHSSPLRVGVWSVSHEVAEYNLANHGQRLATIDLADSVPAQGRMDALSGTASLLPSVSTVPDGKREVRLVLEEQRGATWSIQDQVRIESPLDVGSAFESGDLDFLKDSDGDNVSDANEGLMGTDPHDADSTPGHSNIDVLAFYSQGFPALYDDDPTTRIAHLFSLANAILDQNNLRFRLRLVGLVPVRVEESIWNTSVDGKTLNEELRRHGADINVLFAPHVRNAPCGYAFLGGVGNRGWLPWRSVYIDGASPARSWTANVKGDCGAYILIHEIGHVLGLGHSAAQGSVGTWRWSRGHDTVDDFATIMSYGRGGVGLNVFSSPDRECTGAKGAPAPCGVVHNAVDGADAISSLEAVHYQYSLFQNAYADADGDAYVDPVDAFPQDPLEWWDHDLDGVGNNADGDDDGDGQPDATDAFPLDPGEQRDSDADGVGDNADAFSQDAKETTDSDGDGVGDNGDAFPLDPGEWADTDLDGIGDNSERDDGISRSGWTSYKFIAGEAGGSHEGFKVASAGDVDRDGLPELLIGTVGARVDAFLISPADLAAADASDGARDGVIGLYSISGQAGSWRLTGRDRQTWAMSLGQIGDIDNDSSADFVIGARYTSSGRAYVLSGASLSALDASDGTADGSIALESLSGSGYWELHQPHSRGGFGGYLASFGGGPTDGETSFPNLIVLGAPWPADRNMPGVVHVLTAMELNESGGPVHLRESGTAAWRLEGENESDRAGEGLAVADLDDDGIADFLVGAPEHSAESSRDGAVYIVNGNSVSNADAADGVADGRVGLASVAAQANSWKITGEVGNDWGGVARSLAVADVDGDGFEDVVIGCCDRPGAVYVLPGTESALARLDRADGASDGVIRARHLGAASGWKIAGTENGEIRYVTSAGDVDDDGRDDLLISFRNDQPNRVHLVLGTAFAAAARLTLDSVAARSWVFMLEQPSGWHLQNKFSASAGDVDADGRDDILIRVEHQSAGDWVWQRGVGYLIVAADLAELDAADGVADRTVHLSQVAGSRD